MYTVNNNVLYKDMKDGTLFRLAEPEVFDRGQWMPPKRVMEKGVFCKIGDSHAVRVQSGMEAVSIIPNSKQPCQVLPVKYNPSHIPDWNISHWRDKKCL